MTKLKNQVKVGTVIYDRNGNTLKVVAIDHRNRFWWKFLCETTSHGGWAPPPSLIREYGLSRDKRYWGYTFGVFEDLWLSQRHAAYEVE